MLGFQSTLNLRRHIRRLARVMALISMVCFLELQPMPIAGCVNQDPQGGADRSK